MTRGQLKNLTSVTNRSKTPLVVESKNSFIVIPFDIVFGFSDVTNVGEVDDNTVINDFTTFNRVFNGIENVIAT
jgi:hypothetical protein